MELIKRMLILYERVNDPTLNNGKKLNEATVSFKDYWDAEKGAAKKKMWGYIVKARKENPELYKNVTPRHVDFLINVFGTKYGPQMTLENAVNILKNPDRFVSKVNDYFSNTTNNPKPSGLKELEADAQKNSLDPEFVVDMLNSDISLLRKSYLNNFKKFITNRDAWRAKLEKNDLTNKIVSYYLPNSGKESMSYTAVAKGKVIIDFSFMTDKSEKAFEKLAGEIPKMEKNKAIAEAAETQSAPEEMSTGPMFDLNELKASLGGFVLLKSNNTKRNMIMSKRNIVPSNAVINDTVPTKGGGAVNGNNSPVYEPTGGEQDNNNPVGDESNNERPTIENLINADPNAKRWFDTPFITFDDGKLFINNFQKGETKGLMNKLFTSVTKSNYHSNAARKGLEDFGFKFSNSEHGKDLFSDASYGAASPSIERFLINGSKSIQHITKNDGEKYYLNVLRNVIIYKIDEESNLVTKITINKTNFERKYGVNAVSLRSELFKDIDPDKIKDTGITYEIV